MATMAAAILLSAVPALAAGREEIPLVIDDFRSGRSDRWETKIFKGETIYAPVVEEGRSALKAESRASASALVRRISLDLRAYPRLAWSWKVSHTIRTGNERKKAGDDYAARVYVVFPAALFWKTRTVNYIWANHLPRGAFVPNAYTANAVMVAVETGDANAGRWMDEERNVLEDFRRAFGEDPPQAGAVAIMTDTDDTGEEAVAWYGPIRFLPPVR